MVRLALEGQFVPYAVNVSAGAEVSEAVRPFVGLAERLGSLAAGLADGGVRSIVASYLGRVAEHDTRVLTLAILKGILGRSVHEPVSFVNAPLLARDRGLTVSEMRSTGSQDYVSQISLRAETESETEIEVAGTLLGKKNAERVIQVWDFEVEIEPAPHMLFFVYEDRPGIIGQGRHDPRRARHQHRHDGGRSEGGRGRRAHGAHGRLAGPARRAADGRRRDRRAHDPRRHARHVT